MPNTIHHMTDDMPAVSHDFFPYQRPHDADDYSWLAEKRRPLISSEDRVPLGVALGFAVVCAVLFVTGAHGLGWL